MENGPVVEDLPIDSIQHGDFPCRYVAMWK